MLLIGKKKRLKKKQQKKQNIAALKKVGITDKKVIRELKNKPTAVNKIVKKKSRSLIANERSELIKRLGFKVSEHSAKRYWSESRFNEWYNNELKKRAKAEERKRKAAERKARQATEPYLLIYWKEKTDTMMDSSIIENLKREYKYMSVEYLIKSIRGFLGAKLPAEIGTVSMHVVPNNRRKSHKAFMRNFDSLKLADMNSWLLLYEGKADLRRYKELLLSINAAMRLLYDPEEKGGFVGDLIQKYLPQVNMKTAERLAKDLKWRGGF
ncbi:hypothetical protein HQK35_19030 [Bacillus velezensis]|uniref:hypothetical protein n=1 Tax=Bacillus velezensis TaxID=492670 RepID=UPI00156BC4D3|nr:hypothetical protein [Bacillus velezensis]NRQ87284.1 hypothetical protein [Bacillus velezensis]NRR09950.1 hypothetical protein [Bacillus velezensis]NRR58267.1 hypothetical protein [Bacillus velezensis]NRR71022.1 hypothetical protein [Bacillus velezensis]NRR86232.1 hypothetical protein [Bacillus velezensis]